MVEILAARAATLLAGCIVNHLSEALDVTNQQCIAAARDEADSS
jgi:hypothetical protein